MQDCVIAGSFGSACRQILAYLTLKMHMRHI